MFVQIDENNKVVKNIPVSRDKIVKPNDHKLIISKAPYLIGSYVDLKYYNKIKEDYILKTEEELYSENLKEIPKGTKLVDGVLEAKTVDEKLADREITAEYYIDNVVRSERDVIMKFVLNRIDQYEKEVKQVELEIIDKTSWTAEDYKKDLILLQELRDLPETINPYDPVYPEIPGI